jgi:hypothetical protein
MHRHAGNRGLQALLITSVAVLLTAALFVVRDPFNFAYATFPDDALFYNIIARNIVQGLGSTSDGLARTNGYHPLWMLIIIALNYLTAHVLAVEIVLLFLLAAVSLALALIYVSRYAAWSMAICMIAVLSVDPTFFGVAYSGMESGLALLLLAAILCLLPRRAPENAGPGRCGLIACLLALLFLARLDGGLLWLAYIIAVLIRRPPALRQVMPRLYHLAAVLALPAAVAGTYFYVNQAWFGSYMPVSGRIKSLPLRQWLSPDAGDCAGQALIRLEALYRVDFIRLPLARALAGFGWEADKQLPLLCLTAAGVLIAGMLLALRRNRQMDFPLTVFTWYIVLHSLYYIFLQRSKVSLFWAHGPQLLYLTTASCVIASRLAQRLLRPPSPLVKVAIILLVFALAQAYNIRHRWPPEYYIHDNLVALRDFHAALAYIRHNVPADAVIASHNIGFLGYRSGCRVMSVDGLLNSYDYYKSYLLPNRVYAYMREHGIHYIADSVPSGSETIDYISTRFPGIQHQDIASVREFTAGCSHPELSRKYAVLKLR